MVGQLIYIIAFITSFLLYYFAPEGPNPPFMGSCIAIASFLIFIHIRGKYVESELSKVYLRHSVVFLIIFFIVFFQRALDYSLGIMQSGDADTSLVWGNSPQVVSRACALSLIALSSFLCGYSTYINRCVETEYSYVFHYQKYIIFGGFFLLLIHIIQYGIGDFSKKGDENTAIFTILQAVFLALLVIYIYDSKYNYIGSTIQYKRLIFPFLFVFFYLFVYFASGNRGGGIKVALIILISYLYLTDNKVNYKKILLVGVFCAFAFSVIGIVRVKNGKDVHAATEQILKKHSVSPFTSELAGSINTVHVAMAHVPSKQDYNYGSTFFPGFSVLVPGLSRILPKSDGSGDVITKMFFGGNIPSWGWGFGSSAVADVYLSFGMFGVLFIFFIFGRFIHYLEYGTFCVKKSPLFLVLSFCVYSQLVSLCRGPFFILFLSWDYAFLMVLFCMKRVYGCIDNKMEEN